MQNVQELFDKLQEMKKEMKEINRDYKDALINANEYEETTDELKRLREKKKQIENITKGRMGAKYARLEDLKKKSDETNQLITDIAMSTLMEGKTLEIKDEYQNSYEPVYKITFRKIA